VEENLNLITDPLLNKAISLLLDSGVNSTAKILEQFEDKLEREHISQILMSDQKIELPESVVQECLKTLKTQPIKEKIEEARLNIRDLEAAGKDSSKLILEVGKLQKELHSIS